MSSRYISPFFDVGSGIKPSSGAKLFFFEPDGVTPKDTFSDQLTTPTPNTNPVIADSNGVFGDIFIVGEYKNTLKDKNDIQIFGGVVIVETSTTDSTSEHFDRLNPATLAIWQADTSAEAGDVVTTAERSAGNGGGGTGTVISGIGTVNGFDKIQHGTLNLTWVLRINPGDWVTITQLGAIGDNTGNQAPAINYALANFDLIRIPVGIFLITQRVIWPRFGVNMKGVNYQQSEIRGNSGAFDILEYGTGGFVSDCLMEDVHLNQASATGGHTILQSIGTAQMVYNRVKLTQKNPARSLYFKLDNGLDYVDNHWRNFTCFHLESATIASFSLVDATGGLVNSNSWTDGRMTFSGDYSFLIESAGASSFQFDNIFKRINFEVCSGGHIKALGVFGLVIEECFGYDTPGNYLRDIYFIGQSTHPTTPLSSRFCKILGGGRRSGSLAGGVLDIRLQTGGVIHTMLQGGNNGTSTGYSVSLGANTGITVIGEANWTLTEVDERHIFLSTESGAVGTFIGTSIRYGNHPTTTNAAFIDAVGGLIINASIFVGDSTSQIISGSGAPEGVVTANTGSLYQRESGGGVTAVFVKSTGGLSNTGWVAIA